MAIGLTNSVFVGGGTTGTISSGAVTTALNDYLFASVHFDNHTAGVNSTVTGVTDSLGNTWTKLASATSSQSGQFQSTELWGAVNTHSGASVTVSIATSGTRDASSAYVSSFNGVDTNYPIAVPFTFVTNYTASAVSLSPSGTLNSDNAAIITGYSTNDNAAQETLTSATGWTTLIGGSSGSSCQRIYDKIASRSGTAYSAAWNAGDRSAAYLGALRASGAFATGLDGFAEGTTSSTGTTPVTVTLTTTQANDVIVAAVYFASLKSGTAPAVTSITGTNGLTWTRRSTKTITPAGSTTRYTTEVWYAIAVSALASKTITVNFSASCDCAVTAFGVSGANTSVVWEPHTSLPNENSDVTGGFSSMVSGSWSTTNPDDFIFACGTNNGSASATAGGISGVISALIGTGGSPPGSSTGGLIYETEYRTVASAQSAQVSRFGGGTAQYWHMVTDAITAGGTGITNATGTISTTLTKPALALAGKETFTGTINTALSKAQLAATGSSRFVGTITMSLSRVQMALVGKETFSGTITTHLQGISQHLTTPGNANGVISMTLPKTLLAAVGEERFIGTINTALRGFNVAQGGIVAREIFVGSIRTDLSGFLQIAGVAEERFVGTIRTRLGVANTLVTTDVKGLLIILGDIYTNLYPPDLTLLGAKIGAPGQGQWYSYRYLDSGSS